VNGRRRPPSLPHNRAESSLVLGERCDMRPLTGFAHALICQRVALPSFSVLAPGAACEERTIKELVLPVPKMVSATYVVPVPTPMGTAETRQKASTAVETRLTGPLRTLTAEWLAKGVVKVRVEAAGPLPSGLLDRELFGTPEQRVFLARARAFVRFSATQRASPSACRNGRRAARPRRSLPRSAHPCWTRRRSRF
jgi:hypothetical protein